MTSRGSSISQTVYETISSFDVRTEKYDLNCWRIESWTRIKVALFKVASLKRNDRNESVENIVSFEKKKKKKSRFRESPFEQIPKPVNNE